MPSSRPKSSMRIACLALVLAVSAAAVPASAAPSSASVADAQAQASAARAKLAKTRSSLAAGLSAYSHASRDLARTRADVATNTKRLAQVNASLSAGQESLDSQAQFLYRTDGTGFIDVLLASATFDEFASRLSVLKEIAAKDAGLVISLKDDRAEARRLANVLRERETRQKTLLAETSAERDRLQSSMDEQQAYLGSLSAQVQALVDAQEQAARDASASHASAAAPSAPKATPVSSLSDGGTGIKQVTVEGRSGTYWAAAGGSSSYSPTGVKFSGGATVYGVADNGTGTASGRPLSDDALTCAHRTLPFGTRIAVTHGSRRVIVVVTDRGPYTSGRVIDLTKHAARLLGVDGVGSVTCEVVEPN